MNFESDPKGRLLSAYTEKGNWQRKWKIIYIYIKKKKLVNKLCIMQYELMPRRGVTSARGG